MSPAARAFVALLGLSLTAASAPVGGQEAVPPAGPERGVAGSPIGDAVLERRTSEVASELRCPVCQGVSVEDSPTELARQMRDVVREQLAAGRSPDEVRAYFVDKYGEWILLKPKASGFNLVVYVLPWLVVLAGIFVVIFAVRRWTRPLPAEASETTAPVAGSTVEP